MRASLVLALLLIGVSFALDCSKFKACSKCDAAFDTKGYQLCSWCPSSNSCVKTWGFSCAFKRLSAKKLCPVEKETQFAYNDTLARNTMLTLSAAAYSATPQKCLTNKLGDAQLKRQITKLCSASSLKTDTCSGFTAVSHADKAIFASFRGTTTSWQLLLEGVKTVFHDKAAMPAGGEVSKYFFEAFMAIWKGGMDKDLTELIKANKGYQVWVTGHSLGGAIATIAAEWFVSNKLVTEEDIKLITFGQPRVGDYTFASIHDSLLPYSYRVTHKADMIPHLPMKNIEGYRHHGDEVWYNNNMKGKSTFEECSMHEEGVCSSKQLFDMSILDHLVYFGINIADYGRSNCEHAKASVLKLELQLPLNNNQTSIP